ncbi:hypothetical protein GP486_004797 [Trichoglossum hirsutum]|uniref:Lytic polysaccharide monooxygenase n=1 Tax=Trichoglossum hirsutum TaxID=265104 RepID=A0A9P8LAH5_9PEZI|nr:hypothetical protein GP486_004797 [Trichoglossum hirsutum]
MKLSVFTACVLFSEAFAHMQLLEPPPLGGSNNPFLTDPPDPYLQYPYNCCGRVDTGFCHGHLNLLGTPQGQPVATWAAGSVQGFSLTGIGNHYGGSCQVGFSADNGITFQVATSFEGNCPHRHSTDSQDFEFTVPADIPLGNVVFAWIWYNREQEFNMNCAVITITEGADDTPTPSTPFNQRPFMLLADVGNGCLTPKTTTEVMYPNPGPDVVMGDGEYALELPYPPSMCGY